MEEVIGSIPIRSTKQLPSNQCLSKAPPVSRSATKGRSLPLAPMQRVAKMPDQDLWMAFLKVSDEKPETQTVVP
jgi:hypothetical protein